MKSYAITLKLGLGLTATLLSLVTIDNRPERSAKSPNNSPRPLLPDRSLVAQGEPAGVDELRHCHSNNDGRLP